MSAGGTGGHLFPAQRLAEILLEEQSQGWEILFVAGGLSNTPFFSRDSFCFEEVSCATFSFSKPLGLMKNGPQIFRGILQSRRILQTFQPDLVVGFGSFFTLPVLLAAAIHRIPIILHEQNAIPGKVNRFFSSLAHTTAITFPHSKRHLKGKTVEVSFPIRKKTEILEKSHWDYFGMNQDRLTLLVFGGSKGASFLNQLFLTAVANLKRTFQDLQVIHFTGHEKMSEEVRGVYEQLSIHAYVKAFEPHIAWAMQIADSAFARAGAGTIAELIEYELPAFLVPYPFASDNHQEKNAEHFVHVVKGGAMSVEKMLTPSLLTSRLCSLFASKSRMKDNIRKYKAKQTQRGLDSLIKDIIT